MYMNQSRPTSIRYTSLMLIVIILSSTFFSCTDEALELSKRTSTTDQTTSLATTTMTVATPVDCSTCKYVVPTGVNPIDGIKLGIQPGDVICLDGTKIYGALRFTNIVGTATNPVTIRVCGPAASVVVPITNSYGVKFERSKYFRLTGGDVDGVYGINVKGGNIGISFDNLTTNFEVDHVEVSN